MQGLVNQKGNHKKTANISVGGLLILERKKGFEPLPSQVWSG